MSTAPILTVDSFKLETTFSPVGVVHERLGSDDEVWIDLAIIGRGGQGTVYLQQLQIRSPRPLRAVKKLSSEVLKAGTANVIRELNTMLVVHDVSCPSSSLGGRDFNVRGLAQRALRSAIWLVRGSTRKRIPRDGVRSVRGPRAIYQVHRRRKAGLQGGNETASHWTFDSA